MKKLFLVVLSVCVISAFADAVPALPGASKVWGAGGNWANYAEVVTKVEAGDVTAAEPLDDAIYRLSKKMSGQITSAELLTYANGKKAAWVESGNIGIGAYYQLLRFAARNEKDADFVAGVVATCKSAVANPAEAAAASNALYWIYADSAKCGEALLYWQPHYQPRSLHGLIELGIKNGSITPERAFAAIRDYLYTAPSQLDGAMACKLYDMAMRLSIRAGITTDDLKTAVTNLDQLYASVGTGNADWERFRQKIQDQLEAFQRAAK